MKDQTICSTCREIFLNPLVHNPPAGEEFFVPFEWRMNHDEFDQSLRRGCSFCRRINNTFGKFIYQSSEHIEANSDFFDTICLVILYCIVRDDSIQIYPKKFGRAVSFKLIHDLGLTTMLLREFNSSITRYPANSKATFESAQKWLKECDHEHTECPKLGSGPLPTRILDVNPKNPRLVTCQDRSPYAALSYCWGTDKVPITTKEAFRRYSSGIEMEILPQSIQDAIETTRKLGLRYLWVDSLCILQDCDDDKSKEMANMDQIYQNAYVTISAASASNCLAGFLSNPKVQRVAYMEPIALPYRAATGQESIVYLYQQDEASMRSPIHARAWTMQEHLLSPRLIVFSSLHVPEVSWLCKSHDESPDAPAVLGVRSYKDQWKRMHRLLSQPKASILDQNNEIGRSGTPQTLEQVWEDVVEEYSSRNISDVMDRLPALSGLAKSFQPHIQGEYVAGIWSCWLIPHLLWKVTDSKRKRPSTYIGPTWSWLSVNGSVQFGFYYHELSIQLQGVKVVEFMSRPLANNAPFGKVREAFLRVQGHLQGVSLDFQSIDSIGCCKGNPHPSLAVSEINLPIQIRLEFLDQELERESERAGSGLSQDYYRCLPLVEYQHRNARAAAAIGGLVLHNTSEVYQRVGWFSCNRGWNGSLPLSKHLCPEQYAWLFKGEASVITIT